MLGCIVNWLLGYAYYHEKNYSFEDIAVAKQINEAKIIMRENFKDGIKPEEIASRVNMGYSWFRHIFKTYTGFAPNQYILELKILHGKSLLTNTTLSIKEIAYESGFENQEYFCTIFKKKTGSTPMQYRKATSTPDGTDD